MLTDVISLLWLCAKIKYWNKLLFARHSPVNKSNFSAFSTSGLFGQCCPSHCPWVMDWKKGSKYALEKMERRGEQQPKKLWNRFICFWIPSSPWEWYVLQPNRLLFDDISSEVTVSSWRTGKVSESKRTELLIWSYFRPQMSLRGRMWCHCLTFECCMWENVFENELNHCLAGYLSFSELDTVRVLPGIAVKPMINILMK